MKKYAGIDTEDNEDILRKKAKDLGLDNSETALKGQLVNYIYDKEVEPSYQPVFIMDYPWETSPLAKRHRDNPNC